MHGGWLRPSGCYEGLVPGSLREMAEVRRCGSERLDGASCPQPDGGAVLDRWLWKADSCKDLVLDPLSALAEVRQPP